MLDIISLIFINIGVLLIIILLISSVLQKDVVWSVICIIIIMLTFISTSIHYYLLTHSKTIIESGDIVWTLL